MRKIYIIAIMVLALLPIIASAATINAVSCSYPDVLAAVNGAQSGDTVLVPAGSCTWNNQLVITKGIQLIGAGQGRTIITSGYSAPGTFPLNRQSSTTFIVYYSPNVSLNEPFRLSGFTWNLGASCAFFRAYNRGVEHKLTKIRVDHNTASSTIDGNLISFKGPVYGTVDNNDLTFGDGPAIFSPYGWNAGSWTYTTFEFGTADMMYVEDNVIHSDGTNMITDGGVGGRLCIRHNTIYINKPASSWLVMDMHGNQDTGNWATMGGELYENTIINLATNGGNLIDERGGKALVYNNDITSSSAVANVKVREEYHDSSKPPARNAISGQPQHASSSYYWNNLRNGVTPVGVSVTQTIDYSDPSVTGYTAETSGDGIVPRQDVHFWKQVTPFTGASGMGVGLKSARPASCTLEGAGWWATDESKLYRCHNKAWEFYYTPYTYPHPLRTDCTKYPTLCDSNSTVSIQQIAGDVNGDGKVDISDLSIVVLNFGKSSGFDPRINVVTANSAGIDVADLSFVARRFTG